MRRWDYKIWFYDCDGGLWRGMLESMIEWCEVGVDMLWKYIKMLEFFEKIINFYC